MEIGLSTCSKIIDEKLFIDYKNNGISHMEISTASDEYSNLDYSLIKHLAVKYGITFWSIHFPFSPFSEIDNKIKRAYMQRFLNKCK